MGEVIAGESRSEPHDELADIGDRLVDAIDRAVDARERLVGLVGGHRLDLLERQADRVQALDDPVVQVTPDTLALGHDAQRSQPVVKPSVLDRDPGVTGEQLHQPLVGGAELGRSRLSVRYKSPMVRPATVIGTPSRLVMGG